jgi:hypothetical protein
VESFWGRLTGTEQSEVFLSTFNLENYVKTLSALADGTIPLINSVSYGNDEIQQTSNAYMQVRRRCPSPSLPAAVTSTAHCID